MTGPASRAARLGALAVAGAVLLAPTGAAAQGSLRGSGVRNRMVEREVRVSEVAPEWLAMPDAGRLEAGEGVDVAPLQSASVSYENAALGFLVGAFRNVGACLADVSVRLRYADAQWKPIGDAIESEARVTRVCPGGLLPYRFRLKKKADFPSPPAGYLIQVVDAPDETGDEPAARRDGTEHGRCAARAVEFDITRGRSRATTSSYHVRGSLRVVSGGPIRPDAVMITMLLLDKDQQVLEVLTGAPDLEGIALPNGRLETGQTVPFTLGTPVPLGRWVADVQVFAEVLNDVAVAEPPR